MKYSIYLMISVFFICSVEFLSGDYESFPIISSEFSVGEPVYSPSYFSGNNVEVGFDGENYLVIWYDSENIFMTMVDPEGNVIDSKFLKFKHTLNYVENIRLMFDGERFFLVWLSDWELVYVFVDARGDLLELSEMKRIGEVYSYSRNFSIEYDGNDFFIFYGEKTSNFKESIVNGIKINRSGEASDMFTVLRVTNITTEPPVVFDGDNYFLTWFDLDSFYAGWISPEKNEFNGKIEGNFKTELPFITEKILFDGNNYLLIGFNKVNDYETEDRELMALRISKNGEVLDDEAIKIAGIGEYVDYHASFDGSNYNFFWTEKDNSSENISDQESRNINWRKMNSDGKLFEQKIVFNEPDQLATPKLDAVSGGENYLLAFNFCNSIKAMLLPEKGDIGKQKTIAITRRKNNQKDTAIDFDGKNYLAVWVDDRDDIEKIYGALIDTSGQMAGDEPFLISSSEVNSHNPSVAFNGKEYLVVWEYDEKVAGKRISTSGKIIDAKELELVKEYAQTPKIVSDGTDYLLVWVKTFLNNERTMIYGSRVFKDGRIENEYGSAINDSSSNHRYPYVIFDGENYFTVWQDSEKMSILGKRISKEGAVIDERDILVATSSIPPLSLYDPKVFSNGQKYIVVYREGQHALFSKTVEKNGNVPDKNQKSIYAGSVSDFSMSFDGVNLMLVWHGLYDSSLDIHGAAVSADGDVAGKPFVVSEGMHDEQSPVIKSNGKGNSLVAYLNKHETDYSENSDIRITVRTVTSTELGNFCSDKSTCRSGFCYESVCCEELNCDDGDPNTEDSCSLNNDGRCTHIKTKNEIKPEKESSGCSSLII